MGVHKAKKKKRVRNGRVQSIGILLFDTSANEYQEEMP
jgi:hypothetical protein